MLCSIEAFLDPHTQCQIVFQKSFSSLRHLCTIVPVFTKSVIAHNTFLVPQPLCLSLSLSYGDVSQFQLLEFCAGVQRILVVCVCVCIIGVTAEAEC